MKLTRLDIRAFGRLRDLGIDIASGLHVFYGPNESGKSTIQRALLALLYGFYETDQARKAETAAREKDRPWTGELYSAQLSYELQDGGRFKISRDFSSPDLLTSVWDMMTGREVTDEFGRGRHGNVPIMRRQIGMNRRVFEACACVSQGEVLQVTGDNKDGKATPQEMGDAIISLADSGRHDISAQRAIERLEDVFKNQVGGTRAPTKALRVTQSKLESARRELEELARVQDEVAEDAAALDSARENAAHVRATIDRMRYLLTQVEARELSDILSQLDALEEQARSLSAQIEENRGFAAFPSDERDNILQSWAKIGGLRDTLEVEAPRVDKQRERLTVVEAERAQLAERERALAHLRNLPTERRGAVEALVAQWRRASALLEDSQNRLKAAELRVAGLLAEYEELEDEVGQLSAADIGTLTESLRAPSPGFPAKLARVLSAAVRSLGRIAASALRRLFRRGNDSATRQPTTDPVKQYSALAPGEVAQLLEKHRRYQVIAPDVRLYRSEAEAEERTRSALDQIASGLRAELVETGEAGSDLEAAYARYIDRCNQRGELEVLGGQIQALVNESHSLADAVQQFETDQHRLRSLSENLQRQIETAVGQQGQLDELLEAYQAGCRARELYDRLKAKLTEVEERSRLLLAGKSRVEMKQLAEQRERTAAEMLAANPALTGAQTSESRQVLRDRIANQGEELKQLDLRIQELGTRVSTKLDGLPARAALEEEIERLSQDQARLERFGAGLKMAAELIEQAMTEAHRDFAPSVNRFLGDGLAKVTEGRYQKAMLDPATLHVTTEVPETGRLEAVDSLSAGTRAAAYVLLRAGLAQHMSAVSEPVPLILDDPLTDIDDERIERFLELLVVLTGEIQVLLFTKDAGTRLWFERRCAGDPRHNLTLLTPSDVAQPLVVS